MEAAEQREIAYVFKLKQTSKVKKLIAWLFEDDRWIDAGQGWQGLDEQRQPDHRISSSVRKMPLQGLE